MNVRYLSVRLALVLWKGRESRKQKWQRNIRTEGLYLKDRENV